MPQQLESILKYIFDAETEVDSACEACRNALHAYIEVEIEGGDAANSFTAVHSHLTTCEQCQDIYEDLREVLQMEVHNDLEPPPIEPDFDFSYLAESSKFSSLWNTVREAGETAASEVGQQIQRLTEEIQVVVQEHKAAFGQVPITLTPEWIPSPVRSDPVNRPKQAQMVSLSDPEQDLSFRLIIGPVAESGATLDIEVLSKRSQDTFSKARVTLRDEERRMLASSLTQEEGHVTFTDLETGAYVIEIKHQEKVWQLPVTLAWQESPEASD